MSLLRRLVSDTVATSAWLWCTASLFSVFRYDRLPFALSAEAKAVLVTASFVATWYWANKAVTSWYLWRNRS